ncbi:MAG TPA: glycoside hydrolase family 5 protein, partial [Microlunatus sp.]|nr:glycoside hydrolase family 5 protein [Microlunatus sp.]
MVRWTRALVVAVLVGVGALMSGPAAAAPGEPGWLHTSGSTILTEDDRPYVIRAVAWFGMETPNCAPHGLWQIGLDEGLAQIAGFGFTTVRLPVSNECLHSTATTGVDAQANPDLVGLSPLELMDQVVDRARAHGLSVILDRHRPSSASQSALWFTDSVSESDWIADWQLLVRRYVDDPTVIGVDLHNEPHGEACWGCGDPRRDWAAAATRAGNAVLEENPRLLVIVEGVEHQGDGTATWWGGGLSDVREHPIELAVPHRVVYSPHDYPASIHPQPWFADPAYPDNLEQQWRRSWGYLVEDGIAPVLLGEFGTRHETESDRQWLSGLVDYLAENDISFAYWSFNPNSGDTGGLVLDDWRTPEQAKLDALRPLLGSANAPSPHPSRPSTPTADPAPTAPPAPSPSPSPSGTTSASAPAGSPSGQDLSARWRVTSAWPGGYVAEITLRSDAG